MSCDHTIQIHRYHDGELSPVEQTAAEAHVRECGVCREMLAELRACSALIDSSARAEMPAGLTYRLQHSWRAANDRGVRRTAGWLTGAAAAVLIAALLRGPANSAERGSRPGGWERFAVMPPTEVQDEAAPETVATAQWMAEELSSNERW